MQEDSRARALTDASRELQPRDWFCSGIQSSRLVIVSVARTGSKGSARLHWNSPDPTFGESQTSPTPRGWWGLRNSVTRRTLMTGNVSSLPRTGQRRWGANEAIRRIQVEPQSGRTKPAIHQERNFSKGERAKRSNTQERQSEAGQSILAGVIRRRIDERGANPRSRE